MIEIDIASEFDQCIKCGLCLATCPISKQLLLEKYTPRGKIQLARYAAKGQLELSDHYRDIFSRCLLCGACSVTCPSGVDLKKVFLGMRDEVARKRGVHPMVEAAVRSLATHRNVSDEDNSERGEWTESRGNLSGDLHRKDKAEVVYFVGCVASFFPMVQRIPQNLVKIMQSADVDFAILGGEEWCCGFPLLGAGAGENMQESIQHNLEKIGEMGAKTVVFSCPSCYRTWDEYYHTGLELLHDTQLIERLLSNGSIRFGTMDRVVTYHDPCDLGRNGGVYDSPRRILNAVPGLTFVELENSRAKSVCCGGGGNLEMADSALSGAVAQKKIEEIQRTGAKTVVTACQQCIRTITARARRQKVDLHVWDITELVIRAMANA
jgi:heterodisulfide reductase subunit D